MIKPLQLRWYQQESIDSIIDWVSENDGNPCVVLPTAAGKTIVIAEFIRRIVMGWPGSRVLVLAHVRELIQQSHDSFDRLCPEIDKGIYSAGLHRRDDSNAVIFASIQSVANKANVLGMFDFILVDEAHRIPTKGDGQYLSFIRQAKKNSPYMRVVGLSATPYRLQGGYVCGPKKVLTEVIYEVGVKPLIEQGFLCRPVVKGADSGVDLSTIGMRNGEYIEGELDEAFSAEALVAQTVDNISRMAADRNKWILFGCGTKHIEALQAAFLSRHDIYLPIITGKTPKAERNRTIDEFKAGKYRGLLNINVLSEGFDAPFIDFVGLLRPTKSPGLFYQQVGRGFRIHPSKQDFLVGDFADNVIEHGPVDKIRPPQDSSGSKKKAEPVRKCAACGTYNDIRATECMECGADITPAERELEVRHGVTANGLEILSNELAEKWDDVSRWEVSPHPGKSGKPPTLRVTYFIGYTPANEFLCLEHGTFARAHAVKWWRERGGKAPPPRTVAEAAQRRHELVMPPKVCIDWTKKYPEIRGYQY